ncbi:hypothetical protein [Allochromatium palmeri]|uniref:Uncharacterized protein n=1 Tax=Allochromatium palmeri TaxID=231048 RepID=A0A6N8ECS0_9GAMM|nr:hypothetical protein [Allochromatium palmeri]MTW20689.1 hypothetical protein [Allochromatium palmeri]
MEWSQVLEDSVLKDLPYKIELNEDGHIVMSSSLESSRATLESRPVDGYFE